MLFRNRWQTPQWGATALFFVSLSLRACSCGPKVLPFFLYLTFGSWVSARPRGERENFRHRRLTNKKKIIVLNCQSSFYFLYQKSNKRGHFCAGSCEKVFRLLFFCCVSVLLSLGVPGSAHVLVSGRKNENAFSCIFCFMGTRNDKTSSTVVKKINKKRNYRKVKKEKKLYIRKPRGKYSRGKRARAHYTACTYVAGKLPLVPSAFTPCHQSLSLLSSSRRRSPTFSDSSSPELAWKS